MSDNVWLSRVVTIRNVLGLHARASFKFSTLAGEFQAETRVTREDMTVEGTSGLDLMLLAASPGTTIKIETQGADAEAALAALVAMVEDGFGEECVPERGDASA